MSQIALRPARPDDVDHVVRVVTRAYRGIGEEAGWTTESALLDGGRTDAADVMDVLADPDAKLLVAEAETGEIVGCIKIEHANGRAHFGLFAVEPGLQGSGTGTVLLRAAEDQARAWGCDFLDMEVLSPRADIKAWYERKGFLPTGTTSPFPYGDERFGRPKREDLHFDGFSKPL